MLYKEVLKCLRTQSLPVAESQLRLRLESHPDYPSLLALQDTLEELGVKGYACQETKEELKSYKQRYLSGHLMQEMIRTWIKKSLFFNLKIFEKWKNLKA